METVHAAPPSPRTDSAIFTRGLGRWFGELKAVDAVDLDIKYGEIFGFLGPNGAGKSTTIKMLTTLLAPSEGTALVGGFDIVRNPARVRERIGYVPQLLSADGGLTGRENLLLSAKLYGIPASERDARIDEILGFIGLAESAATLVKTYSGGMIRRLELAQAMLHRPRVLFLDEPTIGLDPVAKRAVWERLLELRRKSGSAVMVTTHDMEEADQLCDRLAILHMGRITAVGSPTQLKSAVGNNAALEDVFAHFSGGTMNEGGTYRDVRSTRRTVNRLG